MDGLKGRIMDKKKDPFPVIREILYFFYMYVFINK